MVALQAISNLLPILLSASSSLQTTSGSASAAALTAPNVLVTSRQANVMPNDRCVQRLMNIASLPGSPECDAAATLAAENKSKIDANLAKCVCPWIQDIAEIMEDKECLEFLKQQNSGMDKAEMERELAKGLGSLNEVAASCKKGDYEAAAKQMNEKSGGPQSLAIGHWFMVGTTVATAGAVLGMF
ncbi:hypothetical protein DFS34DRAFT_622412 [Phlyctochytrium arcticum]|nr:hypothetical protein DFS34DRAFT_622412 [Phlyctochytrium arcticum]